MDANATRAILSRTPGLNVDLAHSLLAAADADIERVLDPRALGRADLPPQVRSYLSSADPASVSDDLAWIGSSGARLILCTDTDYPPQLSKCPGAPAALFVLGDTKVLSNNQLSIVGSRNPTSGGRANAHAFAAALAGAGVTVTSGLAAGIDAASHEGALAGGGPTLAVCGTGLDRVYPVQHADLARRIRDRGALVSEFPPGTPPRRGNFPRRNRLISALSRGTLVVEAALESGSLLTARLAAAQGKSVFAIPGSIHNALARGCHQLIREGARLVEEPAEVLSGAKFSFSQEALAAPAGTVDGARALDNPYEMLLDACGFEPATLESITARSGLPGEAVASMLLILELEGRVAPYPGGRYGRTPDDDNRQRSRHSDLRFRPLHAR